MLFLNNLLQECQFNLFLMNIETRQKILVKRQQKKHYF